jgi:membrane protease YdiL (CAAX protease family)
MVLELGQNPWILILLTFLEILLIIIPAIIASKVEKKSIKEEIINMGFKKGTNPPKTLLVKVIAGLVLGFVFFLIGGYIIYFFKDIVIRIIFGATFVQVGEEGAINTSPINANPVQILIIIILQILIVAPCEEGFFRGFLIRKTEQKLKISWTVAIASTCFAFFHAPPFLVSMATTISYFGYYFTFGVLLSAIFKFFDESLIPGVIAHSFFNILIFIM